MEVGRVISRERAQRAFERGAMGVEPPPLVGPGKAVERAAVRFCMFAGRRFASALAATGRTVGEGFVGCEEMLEAFERLVFARAESDMKAPEVVREKVSGRG